MASHNEDQFDAIRKAVTASEYMTKQFFDELVVREDPHILLHMIYPILVLQGELLEARPSARSLRLAAVNRAQYRRTIVSGGREATYQIDVVTERALPKLLDTIHSEVRETLARLSSKYAAIAKGLRYLGEYAKRSPRDFDKRAVLAEDL
jgi:hypothetical protein